MVKFDITQLNAAVDHLLNHTENPRHRFLLQAYSRHRYLEVAGHYEEIFAPDMMIPDAVYHFNANGNEVELKGHDEIKSLYRMWSETNQSIFFIEKEEIAVADHYIASVATSYQQVSGKTVRANKVFSYLPKWLSHKLLVTSLASNRHSAHNHDMYLYRSTVEMVWPYDDRGRLMGEDAWETEPLKAELIKLDAADVLSTKEAARQLNPLIRPLPTYPQSVSAADD